MPGSVWEPNAADGQLHLVSCPAGHQLVNSSDGSARGAFSHEAQRCSLCLASEFILDARCRACPAWALCDGHNLTSLVPGARWELSPEHVRLLQCPPGFTLERADQDSQDLDDQDACVPCPRGSYNAGLWTNETEQACVVCMPAFLVPCSTLLRFRVCACVSNDVDCLLATSGQVCMPGGVCEGGAESPYPQPGYW